MADEPTEAPPSPSPEAPKKRRARRAEPAEAVPPTTESAEARAPAEKKADEAPRAPKRATLEAAEKRLLFERAAIGRRRPVFGRQAANRYYRIGRDGAWRRPRGQQSKQRRHYGYRAEIVSVGYRSPARVRGLVPSGFAPVLVHSVGELGGIDGHREAAIIARTVGTRRRLLLEEEARRLGIHVLNPIVKSEEET